MNPPIHQYRMDDSAADNTVKDTVGSVNGTILGEDGNAADTETLHVNITDPSGLSAGLKIDNSGASENAELKINKSVIAGAAFSLSMWVYIYETNHVLDGRIISDSDGAADDEGNLLITTDETTKGKIEFSGIGDQTGAAGGITVSTDAWHHYVLTHTGPTAELYIDNTLEETITSSNFAALQKGLMIGNNAAALKPFNGVVSDLMIFDQVLGVNEISYIYQVGIGNIAPGRLVLDFTQQRGRGRYGGEKIF